jgi:heat shock protein HtpX
MNFFRTAILMVFLTGLFIAIGYLIGGQSGMVIAFLFAAGMNLFAYWNSDKMVLRMYNAGGRRVLRARYLVSCAALAENASPPMPKVYIADNPQPNAFATGRIPACRGLRHDRTFDRLNEEELAGTAHELSHVKIAIRSS